jgi:hypothetical protein
VAASFERPGHAARGGGRILRRQIRKTLRALAGHRIGELQVRKHCDLTCGVTVRYHDDVVADTLKLEVDAYLADT